MTVLEELIKDIKHIINTKVTNYRDSLIFDGFLLLLDNIYLKKEKEYNDKKIKQ